MAFNYKPGDEPVPGYRLVRFLGKGAIGEVWQASGPGGTEAALKIIDLAGSSPHARKEVRALQLVKRIHHPNLAPIIAFWAKGADGSILEDTVSTQLGTALRQTSADTLRETMIPSPEAAGTRPRELIIAMGLGHQSLADRLAECQQQGLDGIPIEELLGYMEDAAKAIDFLNSPVHELESGVGAIGHCDIKPLNILIVGGAVQVCDFGLAHIVGAARSTAAAMGTIAYVAPELLEGKPSPATDQYCLAISYFELRTGALPYDQETASAVMKAVLDGALNFSKLPEAEQAVVRKATSKNPSDRFPSALEMVAALRQAAMEEGVALPRRRTPLAAPLKALLAIAFLGVVGFGVWLGVSTVARNGRPWPEPISLPKEKPDEPAAKLAGILKRASELATKADWQSAARAYDDALAIEPANRRALIGRARCSVKFQKYDEAVAQLLRLQPPDPDTIRFFVGELSGAGDEFMKKNSWDSARDAFRRALELDPRNVSLLIRIGRACLRLDLPDDAITHLNAAIQLDALNPDAHFYRGRAYLKKRQYDKALADFERLVQKIDPNNELGYASRKEYGEAYLGVGTSIRDQGKQLLIEAVNSNDPKKDELARAKFQQAVEQFAKGIQHDGKNALLFSRRGTTLLQLGKPEEAVEDLSKAINLDAEGADMDLVYRGSVYVKMAMRPGSDAQARKNLLEKAKADYLAAGKKNPKNADADYLLAECCVQLGDYKGAIGPYDNAIQKFAQWADAWFSLRNAHFYRGNCYLATGDLPKAADDFSQALKLPGELSADPANMAKAFHKLAAEFAKLKQFPQAAQWNQKAIELTPDEASKEAYRAAEKAWKTEKPAPSGSPNGMDL